MARTLSIALIEHWTFITKQKSIQSAQTWQLDQALVVEDNNEIWRLPYSWKPEGPNQKVTFTASQALRAFANQSALTPVPKVGREIEVAFKGLIPPEGLITIEFKLIIPYEDTLMWSHDIEIDGEIN